MTGKENEMAAGFLATHRKGKAHSTLYIPLKRGFLKLRYGLNDAPETLSTVAFVLEATETSIAIGPRLELRLPNDGRHEKAVFIEENAVSGLQWAGGRVTWGHTYDDGSPDTGGESIDLGEWIDRCIAAMIHPKESPDTKGRGGRREGWMSPEEFGRL